jgi:two-component system chemotaxis response regulator CheB
MDVRMPGMDGIEAVERIMETDPTPVVMLSAHTAKGADATVRALARGAVDFLHKPGSETDVDIDDLETELVRTVDAVAGAPTDALVVDTTDEERASAVADLADAVEGLREDPSTGGPTPSPDGPDRTGPTPTVVVGASTGGPKLVEGLLADLPADLGARVLVVQHMPPSFTGRMADHLDDVSEYRVAEASDGATVGPGECLVAKGDRHMVVTGQEGDRLRVAVTDDERVHSVRPAVDVTMESAADPAYGPLAAVVLTGMGVDGAAGTEAMKAAGATTIAQDEETSPVFSMPRNAIETGRVDRVLAPSAIPAAIREAVRRQEAHA